MRNFGLKNLQVANVENFTTDFGMKLRRVINKPLRSVLKLAAGKKIIVDSYPDLEDKEQYIFCSTHYFSEDIIAALATIDRNAYALIGTTDQIDHNPQMYAAWVNGMIYVNRLDDASRKDSVKKQERVIKGGNSVLIFAEGGWNNTENLLCNPLFSGPYILSCDTGKKVVPIATFNDDKNNLIYMRYGDPIDLSKYDKKEALTILRDEMASMMYKLMEEHGEVLNRNDLTGDLHLQHMEERRKEYLKVKWTKDVWDEELTVYKSKDITTPQEVRESLDEVNITSDNAYILAPVLVKRLKDKEYNFKDYMKRNWNKK